tara:strand:+ start:21659 stop:22018 length:360 start_codon:yes stop_codon:yes gene_type:complete
MERNLKGKNDLKKFRVKLTEQEHQLLKLVSAMDSKYQYEVIATALDWARENQELILPLTFSNDGTFRSLYLESSHAQFSDLEQTWSCKTNNALYTATILYLRIRTNNAQGQANIMVSSL